MATRLQYGHDYSLYFAHPGELQVAFWRAGASWPNAVRALLARQGYQIDAVQAVGPVADPSNPSAILWRVDVSMPPAPATAYRAGGALVQPAWVGAVAVAVAVVVSAVAAVILYPKLSADFRYAVDKATTPAPGSPLGPGGPFDKAAGAMRWGAVGLAAFGIAAVLVAGHGGKGV